MQYLTFSDEKKNHPVDRDMFIRAGGRYKDNDEGV